VCEDLRRAHHLKDTMAAWGVTDLLVPVLAAPLQAQASPPSYGWQANAARDFARDVGCRTFVVNSRAHPDHEAGSPKATSFAYYPARTQRKYSRPGPPEVRVTERERDVVVFPWGDPGGA